MLSTKSATAFVLAVACTVGAQTFVTPKLGGAQVAAEMVHINVFYDMDLNQLQATVDDSYGIPELRALEAGYSFDPAEAYVVLNGRAYNAQYGWNAGGFFTIPPGAAIWVEAMESSTDLEVYEGSGRFASYTSLLGTAGSPRRWKWSGVMAHNTYAVRSPITSRLFAKYHVYFGDAVTGERLQQYGDTSVRLEWTTVPQEPPLPLEFGASEQTNGSSLSLQNASKCTTNSGYLVNLRPVQSAQQVSFEAIVPLKSLPATPVNGGPVSGHALPGASICLEIIGLTGPLGGSIQYHDTGATESTFSVPVGECHGTNRIRISGTSANDPYGNIPSARFVATRPGLYCLMFRALDPSTNPVHAASRIYSMYLQAALTISSLTVTSHVATLTFGGERGKQFVVEATADAGSTGGWSPISERIPGTNYLQVQMLTITSQAQFFRVLSQ